MGVAIAVGGDVVAGVTVIIGVGRSGGIITGRCRDGLL